jgi:hypothetical protein
MMVMRTMAEAASGQYSGPRASMIKIRWSELLQAVTEFWVGTLGYAAGDFAAIESCTPSEPLERWPMLGSLYARLPSI